MVDLPRPGEKPEMAGAAFLDPEALRGMLLRMSAAVTNDLMLLGRLSLGFLA
jgi:hypothetical protein